MGVVWSGFGASVCAGISRSNCPLVQNHRSIVDNNVNRGSTPVDVKDNFLSKKASNFKVYIVYGTESGAVGRMRLAFFKKRKKRGWLD